MWQRGCFPTKTLAWPRRLYRMRDRCAVLRTLLQCVCTQRRNCIGQLSPFSEYAPRALRNKTRRHNQIDPLPAFGCEAPWIIRQWRISWHTMPSKVPKLRCDAQLGLQIPGVANRPPRREPAGFAMPFRSHPTLKFSAGVFPWVGTSFAPSLSVLSPAFSTAEMCTNTSLLPLSG
jgi:hypothetical protein